MAYDEDFEYGLRNLEEILQRLDNRVKDAQWVKEHSSPETPARIKEAIIDNFPQRKAAPPPAEPAPAPQPAPAPEPQPELQRTVPPPVEIPALIPEPAPKAEEPPARPPEPEPVPEPQPLPVAEPQPLPKLEPPPALPAIKELPAFLQPKAEPPQAEPLPEPVEQPAPAPKPARKRFVLSRTAIILLCTGLAVAGGSYQLFVNSAKSRYARAGRLAQSARNAEAISAYSRIINLYPGSLEAAYSHYAIGDIKATQGDAAAAIGHYEDYMVAAPATDPKLASSRFKVAELHLKEDRLSDAEYLYQNPVVRESELAGRAAERVKEIQAVKARLAEAKKLIAKTPAKAVEAYSAVVAEHPKFDAALAGLQEAQDALAAANRRPAAKRAPPAKPKAPKAPTMSPLKAALTKPPAKPEAKPAPAATPAPAAAAPKPETAGNVPMGQAETCPMVWQVEQAQGQLSADMMFTKMKFKCEELKQKVNACKEARDAVMALQGVPPEARLAMELEIDPDWTLAKQLEQDNKIRKTYEDGGCAALLKTFRN